MAKTKKKTQLEAAPLAVVTELELLNIRTKREQIEKMARDLKKAATDLAFEEIQIIKKLRAGAPVTGRLKAFLSEGPAHYSPQYKEVLYRHLREAHCMTEDAEIEKFLEEKFEMRKNFTTPGKTKLEIVPGSDLEQQLQDSLKK